MRRGRIALVVCGAASVPPMIGGAVLAPMDLFVVLDATRALSAPAAAFIVWGPGCLLALGTAVVAVVRLRREDGAARRWRPLLASIALATAALASGLIVAAASIETTAAAVFADSTLTVLRPIPGGTCVAVVVENVRLFDSSGVVYAAPRGVIARPAERWSSPDVQRPISNGDYRVDRRGDEVGLLLSTADGRVPQPAEVDFDCG